jgi:two-component system, NtrC family, response regulator AtoC
VPLRVLIIDDEIPFAEMLSTMLSTAGYEVHAVHNGEDGLKILAESPFELVLCDMKMPRMNGLEVLDAMRERGLASTVITMSAFGTIDLAIEALRRGAYDYISKPFKRDEVLLTLRKAEERQQLQARVAELEDRVARLAAIEEGPRPLIGQSTSMVKLKTMMAKVSGFSSTVLVTGESGTGKELVARAIHAAGPRRDGSFVAINCGAIPETLLESELFGHVRGAFTDARTDKKGLFQEAHQGTLFLDEVGELPLALQVGLLRVLQEGEIRPVGGTTSVHVDVRIIAATHRNLAQDVKSGRFREDLLYRLNVLPIVVPPLRDRTSDIPMLAEHVLGRIAQRMGLQTSVLAPEALKILGAYPWPGNVRELENVLERAVVLSDGPALVPDDLPDQLRHAQDPVRGSLTSDDLSIKRATAFIEQELIKRALKRTGGNRTHAAKLLELSPRALLYKIKDYDLQTVGKPQPVE